MQEEEHKRCFKCGETKPLSDFYKHPKMADGHVNKCKECNKKDVRENRETRLDYYQEYDRERSKDRESDRIQKQREYSKRPEVLKRSRVIKKMSADRYPHKSVCRYTLSNAIRDGKIFRPGFCEFCGKQCTPHGHHSSYSIEMALLVTWLCTSCHGKVHRVYGDD